MLRGLHEETGFGNDDTGNQLKSCTSNVTLEQYKTNWNWLRCADDREHEDLKKSWNHRPRGTKDRVRPRKVVPEDILGEVKQV